MEALQRTLRQAIGVWRGLGRSQQVGLGAIAAAALGLLFLLSTLGRTPDMAVAFTGSSDEDTAAIVQKLKDTKIPYEIGERNTIRVPGALVNEVKVMMAGQGLGGTPAAGQGMELFNQPAFGLTEFAQKVNYQRALENELARSIMRMDAVESARVHLVLPQPTLFQSQQKDPTASVILKLKPGKQVDRQQTRAIANLVVGSVEGLKLPNLAIVDVNGNTLTDQESTTGGTGASNKQLEVQRSLEQAMEQNLQALLDKVLGPNRGAVRVSALLNFDQVEEVRKTISAPDPANPAIAQQSVSSEQQAAGGGPGNQAAGGVPGPAANQAGPPTYQGVGPAGQGGYTKQETQTTYAAPSEVSQKILKAPGTVKRLNVSVLLDQDVVDAAQADAIRTALATAAGIDTEGRGDQIAVTALPFSKQQVEEARVALEQAQQQGQVESFGRIGALVLGPIAMMIGLWFILGRGPGRRAAAASATMDADSARRAFNEVLAEVLPGGKSGSGEPGGVYAMAGGGGASATAAQRALAMKQRQAIQEDPQKAYVREQITMLAKTNPSTMAQLIQTWMDEDRRN